MKTGFVNSRSFLEGDHRIDPDLYLSDGAKIRREIHNLPYELSTVGENAENVFYGNIFSRMFVSKPSHGVEYLAASDTVLSDLHTGRYISKIQAKGLSYLILKKGWILVTCSGTLGNVTYTTKEFAGKLATHDLIRIIPNNKKVNAGTLYAFLSSKYGYYQITQSQFGGVVKHINESQMSSVLVPVFSESFQAEVDDLIQESARLREEANDMLEEARIELKKNAHLRDLSEEDYDYYGPHSYKRNVSCFVINRKEINTTTINAFNLSERIRRTKAMMICPTKPLKDILLGGDTFSTGSFPRVEVKEGHGVMLINQRDIFDTIIKGKNISKYGVNMDNLVEYGEVIIAGVGTLGENETFCRALFANEDLVGQLVSGEFIRMKTNNEVPSGYLFAWLSTDYGFRFLRNIQAGTKLCRPIPRLVREIPVPILDKDIMSEIDSKVRDAYTKRHKANVYELKAISMVENEIEKWNKAN
ncbi:methylation-associated defense system restriction endonuclease subunit S MAD5 [Hallella absiana]|uniref:methylation-associated defense system restriction endonuclease subunit S MAD5 n=1 Tax=Hallella absiana TaxID=2925336 RepID=UPI0021C74B1D|nr:restriction endonuclease subunit S [Hallella absiana]